MTTSQVSEFNDKQFSNGYPESFEKHFWNLARNRLLRRLLARYDADLGRILEVGCGTGQVVGGLRSFGLDCVGVEIAPVQIRPDWTPHITTNTPAENLPEAERLRVDTLLVLDVIEHLDEPKLFLKTLVEAYPRASTLVVTVPAHMCLWSNYDEYYGHRRRYSPTTLTSELENLGELASIKHWFKALFPLTWLLARLPSGRPVCNAPSMRFAAIHRLAASWFVLEETLLRPLPFGTSLAALVRLRSR